MRVARKAVRSRDQCAVALSGGTTPRRLYSLLASDWEASFRRRVKWDALHFFWCDERHVPPDHRDSNYRMIQDTLLSKVPVSPDRIHRIHAEEQDAQQAAEQYERDLRAFFASHDRPPRFDIVLLGVGPDGHTASLFPENESLRETGRWVVAPWVAQMNAYRVSLTLPILNAAAAVVILAAGEEKSDVVQAALEGDRDPGRIPVQGVQPVEGTLLWIIDRAAARKLTKKK